MQGAVLLTAGRRAYEAVDCMGLDVLRHVQLHHGLLVVEELRCQHLSSTCECNAIRVGISCNGAEDVAVW